MPSAILVKEIYIPNCKISLAVFVLYPQAGLSEIRGRFPNGVQVRHLRKTSPSPHRMAHYTRHQLSTTADGQPRLRHGRKRHGEGPLQLGPAKTIHVSGYHASTHTV